MADIEVRTVKTAQERLAFIKMPWRIYRDDSRWVAPVIADLKKFLDPKSGSFFEYGKAELYIA